jgi:hypothetical protein
MERAILESVARADLIACQIGSLPWGKMALSLAMAAILIKAVKWL